MSKQPKHHRKSSLRSLSITLSDVWNLTMLDFAPQVMECGTVGGWGLLLASELLIDGLDACSIAIETAASNTLACVKIITILKIDYKGHTPKDAH